jgi:hypothetical protein
MELPYTTPQTVAAAYCVPWNPSDPLIPLYQTTAMQFNTDNDPSLAAIIMVALQNQMMLYRKASCTDCATAGLPPTQTVINPPVNSQQAAPTGAVPTNSTDALAATAANEAAPALNSIVPGLGTVLSDITNIFTSAHASAVAKEQAVNCAVAFAFNKYIPAYDAAVATGQMSAANALAEVTQIINQQLQPQLSNVISGYNWGWGANQVLLAHVYFRTAWYRALGSTENTLASGASSAVSLVESEVTANPLLAIVAIGALALIIGSGSGSGSGREAV